MARSCAPTKAAFEDQKERHNHRVMPRNRCKVSTPDASPCRQAHMERWRRWHIHIHRGKNGRPVINRRALPRESHVAGEGHEVNATTDFMHYGVIMAGGAGTRLWPLSRGDTPKQLLPVVRGKSLLQLSYDRLRGILPADQIYVCTGEVHRAQDPGESARVAAGQSARRAHRPRHRQRRRLSRGDPPEARSGGGLRDRHCGSCHRAG